MGAEAHEPITSTYFKLLSYERFKGLEAHLENIIVLGLLCRKFDITGLMLSDTPNSAALGAGLDLKSEFPRIHKIWSICLENSIVSNALEFVGGIANEYKKT